MKGHVQARHNLRCEEGKVESMVRAYKHFIIVDMSINNNKMMIQVIIVSTCYYYVQSYFKQFQTSAHFAFQVAPQPLKI